MKAGLTNLVSLAFLQKHKNSAFSYRKIGLFIGF
jgi:hypothetical protein